MHVRNGAVYKLGDGFQTHEGVSALVGRFVPEPKVLDDLLLLSLDVLHPNCWARYVIRIMIINL